MLSRLLSFFDARKAAAFGACLAAGLLSCSQNQVTVNLHAMQSSGRVSFVCRGVDNSPTGHKLDECPDYEAGSRHTIALVTQTVTNEVAVVDLAAQSIVDIDKTTPGFSFLRVGGMPGAIVTTPGGVATFVGVTGPEKNGVFALPTTCILPPTTDEGARDLTTWTACHLSSEPGDITVIVDPVLETATGAPIDAESRVARRSCLSGAPPDPASREDRQCPADTTNEGGPFGRRKLLVALPNEHKLVLLDAQRLLDQEQGAFPECQPEATFALDGQIPSAYYSQNVPKELLPADGAQCTTQQYVNADSSVPATPGGFAALGDRVYVADTTRSVVHVLDVSDPCAHTELPSLLPLSFEQPWRSVKTSRVAVSPLSITAKNPGGQQFLYAIDQEDQPAASVMVFDLMKVDPDKPETRTPIIFDGEGAKRQPYMPADRLRFNAPVQDVTFVLRDFPKPDPTGSGEFGLLCEPDPDASGPGTEYRPNSDFSDGARPINLRGMFGFAMLTNGQIAVIDADDFDAPCRRPVSSNMSPDVEDMHGCKGDDISTPYEQGGTPTVTNESSCHIVEQHRPRSASLSISSTTNGVRAPSLRTFPQFSTPSSSVPLDKQPRMMAVDLENPVPNATPATLPAQVNIGSQLFANCPSMPSPAAPPPCNDAANSSPLVIDPKVDGAPNSLTLPLVEPRSYTADQSLALIYEGPLFPPRSSGFLDNVRDPSGVDVPGQGWLRDPDANFCGAGVEDSDTIRVRGADLGIPNSARDAWSKEHADYVQITGDFPVSDDVYWTRGNGQACGRDACVSEFGNIDNPDILNTRRNLSILEASAGQLLVEPQGCTGDRCASTLNEILCCFPAGTAYTVRAANQWLVTGGGVGLHDLAVDPASGRCVHTASCDRRKEHFGQRVFEVCDPSVPFESHLDELGNVIPDSSCDAATNPKVGCVAEVVEGKSQIPVQPGDRGSKCIFENLTSRFVVYRGAQPNVPNMAFRWQTTGGFVAQTISMLALSSSVSPQSLSYLPQPGYLAVVDASTVGLALFDLNSLGVVLPSPYY